MKSIPNMWSPEDVDALRRIKEALRKKGIDPSNSGMLQQILAHGPGSEFFRLMHDKLTERTLERD